MARIRTIKPEFWSSPGQELCRDPYARLLFIAMWNWADDTGRGTANARELAGFAFPWDEQLSSADIRRMLGGIRRAFGVIFYEVGGRPYYCIPSWDKHQKIDKRSGARHPGPEDGIPWDPDPETGPEQDELTPSENPAESSAEPAEVTPNPRRILGAGTGEQGNRGTDKNPSPLAALAEGFDEFWAAAPRKEGKTPAHAAYAKAIKKPGITPALLLERVAAYGKRMAKEGRAKDKIKMMQGWLNEERWNDETAATVVDERPKAWWQQ